MSASGARSAAGLGLLRRARAAGPARVVLGLALLGAVAFYLVSAAHFAYEPLRIEEQEWPPMAEAIVDHGKPVISSDETQKLQLTDDLERADATRIGAWHPPLYLYTLAATMPVFGEDASYALRGVGVVGLLLACALLFLIAREVAPARWREIGAAATILLLLHPYAIQGSTFLDIDTTIYAPALLLVLWLAVRYVKLERRLGVRQIAALSAAIALVCWIKLPTAIVLLCVLGLYWVLARGLRGIPEIVAAIAGGAALFLGTYALWCEATGIAFSYTFDFTFSEKSDRLWDTALIDQVWNWHIQWFLPALLLMSVVYAADAVVSFARTRRPRPMDLVFGFGVAVFIAYTVVSPTGGYYQGKYAFPALPALILPIAWMLLRSETWRARWWSYAAAVVVGIVAALLVPDLLTNQGWVFSSDGRQWLIVLGSAAALLVAWRLGSARLAALPVGAAIVLAAMFGVQSLRSYRADVSPMYPVADTARFEQGSRTINRLVNPGEAVLVSKDIGFYVKDGVDVIEGQDIMFKGDAFTAKALRELDRIKVVAMNSFGPGLGPESLSAVAECFGADASVPPDFVIRVRTRC